MLYSIKIKLRSRGLNKYFVKRFFAIVIIHYLYIIYKRVRRTLSTFLHNLTPGGSFEFFTEKFLSKNHLKHLKPMKIFKSKYFLFCLNRSVKFVYNIYFWTVKKLFAQKTIE